MHEKPLIFCSWIQRISLCVKLMIKGSRQAGVIWRLFWGGEVQWCMTPPLSCHKNTASPLELSARCFKCALFSLLLYSVQSVYIICVRLCLNKVLWMHYMCVYIYIYIYIVVASVIIGPKPLVLPGSTVSEMVIESVSVQLSLMRSCRPEIWLISFMPLTIRQPGLPGPNDSRYLMKDWWDFQRL